MTEDTIGTVYLTTRAAAKALGVKQTQLLTYITTGRLPAEKMGDRWWIKASAIGSFQKRPVGRPPKDAK